MAGAMLENRRADPRRRRESATGVMGLTNGDGFSRRRVDLRCTTPVNDLLSRAHCVPAALAIRVVATAVRTSAHDGPKSPRRRSTSFGLAASCEHRGDIARERGEDLRRRAPEIGIRRRGNVVNHGQRWRPVRLPSTNLATAVRSAANEIGHHADLVGRQDDEPLAGREMQRQRYRIGRPGSRDDGINVVRIAAA